MPGAFPRTRIGSGRISELPRRIRPCTGRIPQLANALSLYGRYLAVSLRGQMQYRASFAMTAAGQFFTTGLEFAAVWMLFERFGQLRGWTLWEVGLFYGVVNLSFALSEAVVRGFDSFDRLVRSGEFDRVLLRPRGTVLQLVGHEFQLRRAGRLLQGAIVLAWAAAELQLAWTPHKALLLAAAVAGGVCLFSGVMILQATLCFWTIEGLELMNALTNGGVFAAQYPLSIYRKWFRRFFTGVVPLACVSYYPVLGLLDIDDGSGALRWLAPAAGPLFLLVCLRVWGFGVRRYRSTGS